MNDVMKSKTVPNTASRTITGITLALPARASVMHPIPGKALAPNARTVYGGTSVVGRFALRVSRHSSRLEVGSGKMALSRPTHQRVSLPDKMRIMERQINKRDRDRLMAIQQMFQEA